MEDEAIINASNGEDRTAEKFFDFEDAAMVSDINQNIEALEQEKFMTMKAITAKAADLESEVVKLHHDLRSAISERDEANTELRNLKKSLSEKVSCLEITKGEREKMMQDVKRKVEDTMKSNSIKDRKIGELEKRIQILLERESETQRDKISMEEESKTILNEKEREIHRLKKRINDLEAEVGKNLFELEKERKEKREIEISKNGVEAILRFTEEKVKEMGSKIIQLQMAVEEEAINEANKMSLSDKLKRLKNSPWPAVSVTVAGTVIAAGAAVRYLLHHRRQR